MTKAQICAIVNGDAMSSASLLKKQLALEKITVQINACPACQKNTVGLPVPGEGSAGARVVFVGEAPGKQEAKSGRPFVGPAGRVLRGMIQSIGLREQDVFITSVLKYLPIHVTPTPSEVEHGRIHLLEQLNVIEPRVIVLLGRIACAGVLARQVSMKQEHGTVIREASRTYVITYHPASVLYSPSTRQELQKDFEILKKILARR